MARTNKLNLAVSLIENEVAETNKKIEDEAKTGHYGKACGFQKHKEGLLQALGFVKVCSGRDEVSSGEDKN